MMRLNGRMKALLAITVGVASLTAAQAFAQSPEQGWSNNGFFTTPTFQSYDIPLPAGAGPTGVMVRFRFDTGDGAYQGFRGVGVDNISLPTTSGPLTEDFESSPSWTFDPEPAPGAPFWHVIANSDGIEVINPDIDPNLVTLPPGDSGAIPAAASGSQYAWFGDNTTGTFCGPDYTTGQTPKNGCESQVAYSGALTSPAFDTGASPGSITFNGWFEIESIDPFGHDLITVEYMSPGTSGEWVEFARLNPNAPEPPPEDTTPPDTTITSGPTGTTRSTSASFSFDSSEPGSSFQCQVDGGAFQACTSPMALSGLAQGAHNFQVRAIDAAGNFDPTPASRAWTIQAQTVNDLPPPTLGGEVNVQELAGNVKVAVAGSAAGGPAHASQKLRFVALSRAKRIPVGSYLDTRKGTVRLQSAANSSGKRKNGDFSGGIFQVKQSKKRSAKGRTDLFLKSGNFKKCRSARSGEASAALSRRTIRRLRSSASGSHRSSGKRSAATVRGTKWTVADRCDGTLTTVQSGSVSVRDFRRKRTVVVRKGGRYLAKAPRGSRSG
jgi:hypothetical protein